MTLKNFKLKKLKNSIKKKKKSMTFAHFTFLCYFHKLQINV